MTEFELSLRDYFRILKKRRKTIILFVFLIGLFSFYQTISKKPLYKSSATIRIERRKNVVSILTDLVTWGTGDVMKTAAETIRTYLVGEKAAIKMGLIKKDTPPEEKEKNVRSILGSITTEVLPNTDLIVISAVSTDSEKAKEMVEAIAEAYIEFTYQEEAKYTKQMRDFIEKELEIYEEKLSESRKSLKEFEEKYGMPYSTYTSTSTASPMDFKTPTSAFYSSQIPEPSLASLQSQLVKKKVQLISLLSRYTEDHPKVKKLQKEIEKIEEEMRESFKKFSSKEEKFSKLLLNVRINEELYTLFTKKLAEAKILESSITKSVEIVTPPTLPTKPLTTNKVVNTIAGSIIGLMLGILIAFIQENFDTSLGTIEEVEEFMNIPVLGVIPYIELEKRRKKIGKRKRKDSSFLISQFPANSPIAEAYGILSTNINFAVSNQKGISLLITSATYEEGKTTVACNCALAMVKSGKRVLLVGADLRKPSIHKIFKIERENGLTELISETVDKEKVIKGFEDFVLSGLDRKMVIESHAFDTLKIITSGHTPYNPTAYIASKRMKNLIEEFKKEYDVIIFDSPPLLPVADTLLLSSKVDGVIIVYQAGRISRIALKRIKSQLEGAGAKIIGIVINNIRAEEIEPGPNYYSYYYKEEKKG